MYSYKVRMGLTENDVLLHALPLLSGAWFICRFTCGLYAVVRV